MYSFEQELKDFFSLNNIDYSDNSSSYKLLDFTLNNFACPTIKRRTLFLEVKEKRQTYNTQSWSEISKDEEPFSFILDDLSSRKILAYAPCSGLLIRDNIDNNYYWFSVLDLYLMPKKRVNRPIKKNNHQQYKGKWIIDLRNAAKSSTLDDIFLEIKKHIDNQDFNYLKKLECYGTFHGENILEQGIVRKANHWDIDVKKY